MTFPFRSAPVVALGTAADGFATIAREATRDGCGPVFRYVLVRGDGTATVVSRSRALTLLRTGMSRRFPAPVAAGTDCPTCQTFGSVIEVGSALTQTPDRVRRCPACDGATAAARLAGQIGLIDVAPAVEHPSRCRRRRPRAIAASDALRAA